MPYLIVRQRRRRMYEFEEQLPEAIDLLGRAIRAGHPLSAGLKMVADETQEPIAGRVPAHLRGAALRPSLRGRDAWRWPTGWIWWTSASWSPPS